MNLTVPNPLFNTRPSAEHPLPRQQLVALVEVALTAGENRYARRAALAWLACFPGDLPVSLLHARSLLQEGQTVQALPILEHLCQLDPEFLPAQVLLASTRRRLGMEGVTEAEGCVLALGGQLEKNPQENAKGPSPKEYRWGKLLRESRTILEAATPTTDPSTGAKGAASQEAMEAAPSEPIERAGQLVLQALVENPSPALAAVIHLNVERTKPDLPKTAVSNLAQAYHERWPECLVFALILADLLMDSGKPDQAVALLHQAASQDVTGQTPYRLWGNANPYRALWPDHLEASSGTPGCPQELSIPAGVASILGWNRLGGGGGGDDTAADPLPVAAPAAGAAVAVMAVANAATETATAETAAAEKAGTIPASKSYKKSYDGGDDNAIPDYPIVGYDDEYVREIQEYANLPEGARTRQPHGVNPAEPVTQPVKKHNAP